MLKRYRFILILSLAAMAVGGFIPGTSGSVRAQTAHVFLEEFTGAWCGYCVRGAYAIGIIDRQYPGQVPVVSYHVAQGAGEPDPMDTPQADSMAQGIGFPANESSPGFPNGWTSRTTNGTSWNADPAVWADSVEMLFYSQPYGTGTVDPLIGQPATATCVVDNVSFNPATQMITARVTANFAADASGDLRLNLILTEDNVTGPSSTTYDQHNYYSKLYQVGANNPKNPYYNSGATVPGWKHMHVFREAVAGIHGQAGIIPASVSSGGSYSTTFSFPIPTIVQNPNNVHLIGIVHQYSATVENANVVFDAAEVPLSTSPIAFAKNQIDASFDYASLNGGYAYSHASGDTTYPITVQNNGSTQMNVTLKINPNDLPQGWTAKFLPSPVSVDAGSSETVTLTVTAPEQSAFIAPTVWVYPTKQDVYIAQSSFPGMGMMSDNTAYGLYTAASGSYQTALIAGAPDTMRLHTSVLPLGSSAILSGYDYLKFNAVFLDGLDILDWTANANFAEVPTVQMITDILSAGGKIFLNSDLGLYYAFEQNYQYQQYTETQPVQDLFAQLGLSYTRTVNRYTTNTSGQITGVTSFAIAGEKNDPIGNGLTLSDGAIRGGGYVVSSAIFSIDSASTPIFYSDNKAANILGAKYIDPTTGARLVYLGFGLDEISVQSKADTIAARSIKWLFANDAAPAAVDQPTTSTSAGITASPNPFNGVSNIQFTAAADEKDVTFAAYDLLGHQVAALATHTEGGNVYSTSFDASKLANGTYVIVANTSKGTHEVRVVSQQ